MFTTRSLSWFCSILASLQLASGRGLIRNVALTPGGQVSVGPQDYSSSLQVSGDEQQTSKKMHFIYTVGCDEYQVIVAVGLDHSWKAVGNKGKLTRIVGGCKNKTQQELLGRSPLSNDPAFAVFFADGDLTTTPKTGSAYPARARPHAIRLWLEKQTPTEDIIVILDPDMVWMRPLSEHPSLHKVQPGFMLAQKYGHGNTWIQFSQAGEEAPFVDPLDAVNIYATGPPWAVDTADLHRMLPDWARYTDAQKGQALMREQNAFNMAALKHGIPSSGSTDLMVSAPGGRGEAWDSPGPGDVWSPYVLHYCQGLKYKSWEFQKSLFSMGWYAQKFNNSVPTPLTCGAALPEEPPAAPTKIEEPDVKARQHAFMLSALIPRLKSAFEDTRATYCGVEDYGKLGLMRVMQPVACTPGKIPQTHYLVESQTGRWDSVLPLGKDRCSKEAQMQK